MTDKKYPWSNSNEPGRMDVDGVEWWACSPYPTWYRWAEGHKLVRRVASTAPPFMDEITEEMLQKQEAKALKSLMRVKRVREWQQSAEASVPPNDPGKDPSRYLVPGIRTHADGECALEHCAIHNPSTHPLMDAPLHYRADRGILERICKHGVGHDDPDDLAYRKSVGREADGVHGCCGCCATPEESTEGTTS